MNPSSAQFDQVTVLKKSNIYFGGKCISHTVQFDDGSRKTIGVILPSVVLFKTEVPERMEIIAGECRVTLPNQAESELFRAGQFFFIPAKTEFTIEALEPIDYVCHFEG